MSCKTRGGRFRRASRTFFAVTVLGSLIPAATVATATSSAECANHSSERQAFFGDLHIHTGASADAMLFGTRNRPDDAYAFARGKEIFVFQDKMSPDWPLPAQLERPLDFAAVTDHAENIGTVSLCMTPGTDVYDSEECRYARKPLPTDDMAAFATELSKVFHMLYTSEAICGADRKRCIDAVQAPWKEIQRAAHQWNNACEFTTFVGYEYSPTEQGANLHHNVIFRSDRVMDAPISSRDVPDPFAFYAKLRAECNDSGTGCEAIAIPHNSNISNGRMFRLGYEDDAPVSEKRRVSETRAEIVRLVEIFQEKGESECRNGLWNVMGQPDEFCDFEKYRDWKGAKHEDCRDGVDIGGFMNRGCVSRVDYTRYALAAGLAEERRSGVNPLRFGVVGATDNHMGTTGDLEEWVHDGRQRPVTPIDPGRMSTGGMAGVWAEENTRESLYAAMHRRETFGTSGPRIKPRLFAGWDLSPDLCGEPEMASRAYEAGVPMGSGLPPRPTGSKKGPAFLVSALQDPGTPAHPGTPLQRIQIVKVWAGEGDELHQVVHDVAGGDNGASVDTTTCEQSGEGAASLCAVWRDPDYEPGVAAAYYARVLENPSCRNTGYACMRAAPGEEPAYCDDASVPKQIQERAWTSPIWVDEGR
jgi:hypothetical protein